jgi:peptide deformylase
LYLELSSDHNLLLQPTKLWNFDNPPLDIIDLAESMVYLMHELKGFGLAANQVGLPYSIFAMRGEPENFVLINPKIVNQTGEMINDLEGCLSYPGLGIKKERWHEVRVRFAGPNAEVYTKVFRGLSARVVQHEMDHLNGIVWWNGVSKLKFDIAKKKAIGRGWKYQTLTYKGILI